ncbi:MAG TPA: ATP synthase F0 subunit B [Desulfobacteraceae bacterium]|jgi:F-type H+-transporting ATPase subunit b|nr:ATP synthase F0 subunit B [Desulfobacteraceae bacterium]
MKRRFCFKLSVASAAALIVLAACGAALAAGGHDSSGELKDLLYRFINFALLVIVLVIVVKKAPLKDFFETRKKQIKKNLESLERQKEEAEKRCRELEAELAAFESERAGIIERFRAEGEAEKDRIISEAHEKARQILLQADAAVKREVKNVEARLRAELADSVAEKAEKLIAGSITDKDQDLLVNEFIERVERLH